MVLAAARALYYEGGLGAPGLGVAVVLPIVVLCVLVARVPFVAPKIQPCSALVTRECAYGTAARDKFLNPLCKRSFAGAVRSGCGMGRRFCPRDRCSCWMGHIPATQRRTAHIMDLECNWSRGPDCCGRTGRPFISRSTAPYLHRAKLRHYDNLALALDSRLPGPAPIRSSHWHFHATGEAQGRFTADARFLVAASWTLLA